MGPPNRPFERLGGIWAHFGLFKRLMAHVKGFVRVFPKSNGSCSIFDEIINNINMSKCVLFPHYVGLDGLRWYISPTGVNFEH